jgi:gamma-glutamyl-gamma-aminobutyrate hydrolase PuuD
VWDEPADLLPVTYSDVIQGAGGVAMLLPPGARDLGATAEAALDGLHGVLLAGGADIDPARYGAARDPHTGAARPDRDGWELALAQAALRRGLPVLGVCRGLQVLNVALGGSLVQHLPDQVGDDAHCPVLGVHGRHRVRVAPDTRLGAIIGGEAEVATHHHQSIDTLADGLVPMAWSDDGVIEAAELPAATWVIGVQWHPEVHDRDPLFTAFVDACATWRDAHRSAGRSHVVAS